MSGCASNLKVVAFPMGGAVPGPGALGSMIEIRRIIMKKLLGGLAALALAGAMFGGAANADNGCGATADHTEGNVYPGSEGVPAVSADQDGNSGYLALSGSNGHFELQGDETGVQGDGEGLNPEGPEYVAGSGAVGTGGAQVCLDLNGEGPGELVP